MSAASAENQPCDYEVESTFEGSSFTVNTERKAETGSSEEVNNSREKYSFSFQRVLEPAVTQEQVFNVVAKDCVQSCLDGYNSTIFAYGQTGSGKTFSITGGTESYNDRGIIPRALAMIYEETGRRKDVNWTISLSYLQIYNDKGQDLLNHGKDAKSLSDLPCVTIHEGEDEVVLKNLDQHFSPTLSDALSLLFLGDTNRLYCETPMNKTSSRSHCVFTVSLEAHVVGSSVIRRSKLNLVDLAGSERVAKTGVDGTLLTEAKYINLSLHYLEHVIVALSEQAKGRREHIPYRNSFMTMVLRDSLGANCRTSMLATVHTARGMIPETLSTCQFAQRVALIRQNAKLNEETDPVLLVKKLKGEIAALKDRLAFAESGGKEADRTLTEDETQMCEQLVDQYIGASDPSTRIEGFGGDLARIFFCFSIMKKLVLEGNVKAQAHDGEQLEAYRSQVEALQVSLQQKENEMTMLFDMLHKTNGPKMNASTQTIEGDVGVEFFREIKPEARSATATLHPHDPALAPQSGGDPPDGKAQQAAKEEDHAKAIAAALTDAELLQNRGAALEAFKQSFKGYEKVDEMKRQLKPKYESCKITGREANAVNARIKHIKREILKLRADRAVEGVEEVSDLEQGLLQDLHREKDEFTGLIERLKKEKEEIQGIEAYMERSKEQLAKHFEEWLSVRQQQVQLAMKAMHRDATTTAAIPTAVNTAAQHPQPSQPLPYTPMTSLPADTHSHPSSAPSAAGPFSPLHSPAGGGENFSNSQRSLSRSLPQSTLSSRTATHSDRMRHANPFHLQPLQSSPVGSPLGLQTTATTTITSSRESAIPASSSYTTYQRSTGDAAADEQLAALYRAREALRQNLSSI